ncbi:hypothetical protein [Streptomyces lavendofoliae]|uniref:hypothetical protein n=1 Tax=Streptomyces lavendofoliae TaxID=67314 RepID=UPI00300F35A1
MSGAETMGHLHDLINTVTRGVTTELGYAGPGVALDVLVGKRYELALQPAHVDGLTRLLRHAAATIGARSRPGGGRCFHCDGTGLAHPLVGRTLYRIALERLTGVNCLVGCCMDASLLTMTVRGPVPRAGLHRFRWLP